MAVLSFLIFGGAFGLAAWAMWATIAPKASRIAALLAGGREIYLEPLPMKARGTVRRVTVRRLTPSAPLRAAA